MKFLLVLAVILIGFWLWRSSRERRKPPPPGASRTDSVKAIEMVCCDVCGVHCPKADSVPGKVGVYCTQQHRRQAEP